MGALPTADEPKRGEGSAPRKGGKRGGRRRPSPRLIGPHGCGAVRRPNADRRCSPSEGEQPPRGKSPRDGPPRGRCDASDAPQRSAPNTAPQPDRSLNPAWRSVASAKIRICGVMQSSIAAFNAACQRDAGLHENNRRSQAHTRARLRRRVQPAGMRTQIRSRCHRLRQRTIRRTC